MNIQLQEKTICREKTFSGRVFQVEVRQVELSDGSHAGREIVLHDGGACIVPMDVDNNIYMVSQYRAPFDRIMLEIPAGKLERGEAPLSCAVRELAEETGFQAQNVSHLATIFPSPGYCSEILHIYLGTGLIPGPASPDTGEILTCTKYRMEELLAQIDRGEICDAKTVVALLALDRKLKAAAASDPDTGEEA